MAGRRVLISTGTRTLQDQIFYKDVPAVSRALGRDVRAAYMKGRTNYLCLHRFAQAREGRVRVGRSTRRWFTHIAEWAEGTVTGDRSEIEDLPDDLPLWADVSATSEQCLGRDCAQYAQCFVTRMRDVAAEADVVIVNHHLLCADAAVRRGTFGGVIPDADVMVIDEAHQFEDVVTQYFGVSVGTHRLEQFVRDIVAARRSIPSSSDEGLLAAGLSQAALDTQEAARRLFETARSLTPQDRGGERALVSDELAARLAAPGTELENAIDRLIGQLVTLPDPDDDVAALRTRAETLKDDLAAVIGVSDARYVHFIEVRGRSVQLRAAPIDASSIIREKVLAGRHATLFTSATLTVGGSFDYALGRLGAEDADTLLLPAEFDYRRQAILYLPRGMPDPRSADFNAAASREILELLRCTNGRAFVLFTSYAALRDVERRVAPSMTWPLFVQGSAPRTSLLRDFRATPHAVLFATSSFWQGVDVAGDALSSVIIDRLPFASPADPLVAARMTAIEERGGQPFQDYQVPVAALTLLQGLGRLIRTRSDRGVMAVLDPRLTTKAYGARFLQSMPPAPITSRHRRCPGVLRPLMRAAEIGPPRRPEAWCARSWARDTCNAEWRDVVYFDGSRPCHRVRGARVRSRRPV